MRSAYSYKSESVFEVLYCNPIHLFDTSFARSGQPHLAHFLGSMFTAECLFKPT